MKTIKSVGAVLLFSILAQVPVMAVWFSPAIPEKVRLTLVTVLSFIFLLGIVENFRKRLILNYSDIGVRFPTVERIKKDSILALAAGAAGLICCAFYFKMMKLALPAIYEKLITTKSDGYVSSLVDWGRTYSLEGSIALPLGMLLIVAGEELLFRGLIFNYIRREETETKAFLWSSVLFALMHLRPTTVPLVFLLGLLCAWLYKRSGSLLSPIIAHLIYNLGIVYFGPFFY